MLYTEPNQAKGRTFGAVSRDWRVDCTQDEVNETLDRAMYMNGRNELVHLVHSHSLILMCFSCKSNNFTVFDHKPPNLVSHVATCCTEKEKPQKLYGLPGIRQRDGRTLLHSPKTVRSSTTTPPCPTLDHRISSSAVPKMLMK